jgi:hypothetical protein
MSKSMNFWDKKNVELQAKRNLHSWKTKEEMVAANLMELQQAKMGLVPDDDETNCEHFQCKCISLSW